MKWQVYFNKGNINLALTQSMYLKAATYPFDCISRKKKYMFKQHSVPSKHTAPSTIPCIAVYPLAALGSAFSTSSHRFFTPALCSLNACPVRKMFSIQRASDLKENYFCSSQGTFNTEEQIQLKIFSAHRRNAACEHFILLHTPLHLPSHFGPHHGRLTGKRHRAMKANSSSEEKSYNVTHTMAWGIITKLNYKYILEVSVFSFIWYAHSFIFFFPFSWFSHAPGKAQADDCAISQSLRSHGCYCAIDMKRPQKYSPYYYSVWSVLNSKLLEENVKQ